MPQHAVAPSLTAASKAGLHWYVAQTRPRQEAIAELNLQRQGFSCYLPRLTQRKRVRGHWQAVTEPLFPGYIFVQMNLQSGHIAPLFSTKGIRTLVRFGPQYLPFDDSAVRYLQLQEKGKQDAADNSSLFQPGDALCILEGPFKGLSAVYQCSKARDRVEILVQLLGAPQLLVLPQDQVCSLAHAGL